MVTQVGHQPGRDRHVERPADLQTAVDIARGQDRADHHAGQDGADGLDGVNGKNGKRGARGPAGKAAENVPVNVGTTGCSGSSVEVVTDASMRKDDLQLTKKAVCITE